MSVESASTARAPSPVRQTQVRRIEIRARRLASSLLAGDYRSVFRGSGIEFSEAREYTPGDDVRLLDWNVTARMGAPWVKEFVEERELTVVCAVDVSASQWAARPAGGRIELAAQVTALLGFSAAYHNDRAGLLLFAGGVEAFVPPARGSRHVLRLVRQVLDFDRAPAATNLGVAAEYLARVLSRRSIVFFITDGFDIGFEAQLRTLARRHEVIALTITDPLDRALPDVGLVELTDAENGRRVLLDTSSARVRAAYAEAATTRASARRAAFIAAGVDEVELSTEADFVEPLVAYFRRRAARR